MSQCNFVIKDQVTGLFLTTYSTDVNQCQWGSQGQFVCFDTQQQATDTANDMNSQLSAEGRFIGINPPPR